jgi:hypothetical protein
VKSYDRQRHAIKKASVERFDSSILGRNNFRGEFSLKSLFEYLMEFETDVLMSSQLSCLIEINIRVLSSRVIRDNGGIESLISGICVDT